MTSTDYERIAYNNEGRRHVIEGTEATGHELA
jgi:hypothetical protein